MTQNSLEEEKQCAINTTGAGSGNVERLERKNGHRILVL